MFCDSLFYGYRVHLLSQGFLFVLKGTPDLEPSSFCFGFLYIFFQYSF